MVFQSRGCSPRVRIVLKHKFHGNCSRTIYILPDWSAVTNVIRHNIRGTIIIIYGTSKCGLRPCLLRCAFLWQASAHAVLQSVEMSVTIIMDNARIGAAKVQGVRNGNLVNRRREDSPIYSLCGPRSTLLYRLQSHAQGICGYSSDDHSFERCSASAQWKTPVKFGLH